MKNAAFIAAAGVFAVFFITIIIIADRGEGDRWWSFINQIPSGDKIGHIGLVGTLSLLCNLAVAPRKVPLLPGNITRTTFLLFVLLSTEEISQTFLPERTCDFADWLADLAGLALGQILASLIRSRFFR